MVGCMIQAQRHLRQARRQNSYTGWLPQQPETSQRQWDKWWQLQWAHIVSRQRARRSCKRARWVRRHQLPAGGSCPCMHNHASIHHIIVGYINAIYFKSYYLSDLIFLSRWYELKGLADDSISWVLLCDFSILEGVRQGVCCQQVAFSSYKDDYIFLVFSVGIIILYIVSLLTKHTYITH